MKKLFISLMACAALCACHDEDIVSISNYALDELEGTPIYMMVSIRNAETSSTRADSDTNATFANGTTAEQLVTNASFYFYDSDGNYVTRGENWDGGTASEEEGGNVEFQSNTVVAIYGLAKETDDDGNVTDTYPLPTYMVTVLNVPKGFTPGNTLDEMQTALTNATDGCFDSNGNFVMSSSSYVGYNEDRPAYFVTTISESDYSNQPVEITEDYNAVQVYVERLAAKVEVDVDFSGLTCDWVEPTDKHGYLIPASYLGISIIDSVDITTGAPVTSETESGPFYVDISGWKLNAVARNSNMVKNIADFTLGDAGGIDDWTTWNDPNNSRSYWGASWNYDKEDGSSIHIGGLGTPTSQGSEVTIPYPIIASKDTTSYDSDTDWSKPAEWDTNGNPTRHHNTLETDFRGNTAEQEADTETALNKYLRYVSLNEGVLPFSTTENPSVAYCSENTNPTSILNWTQSGVDMPTGADSPALTGVLVKGQFGELDASADTLKPVDLIFYRNRYYTIPAFKNHIAARVIAYDFEHNTSLAALVSAGVDAKVYLMPRKYKETELSQLDYDELTQFDGRFIRLMDWGDGKVSGRVEAPLVWGVGSGTAYFFPSDKYQKVYDEEVDAVSPAELSLSDYDFFLAAFNMQGAIAWAGEAVLKGMGIEYYFTGNASLIGGKAGNMYARFGGNDFDGTIDASKAADQIPSGTGSSYDWRNYMLWEIERECWTLNWYLKENGMVPQMYNQGNMYYSAPIQHLNDTGSMDGTKEGEFGVVRNHWYKVTLNNISHIGMPISNINSVIVPQTSTYQYLGTSINILSWRTVGYQLSF